MLIYVSKKEGRLVENEGKGIVSVDPERAKTLAQMTFRELKLFYRNTSSFDYTGEDYSSLVKTCKQLLLLRFGFKEDCAYLLPE
jgi:hypothetical protein